MLATQSPLSDSQIHRPKSNRKALQPNNTPATPINNSTNQKPKPKPNLKSNWFEIPLFHDSNKENIDPNNGTTTPEMPKRDPVTIELLADASLAEELSAIREKLDRLKVDKDKTDKMLKDRDLFLDKQMKDLETRGQVQKYLEIEMDRLYRLKELKFSCMRKSPIRSLREKEEEKKLIEDQAKETSAGERDAMKDEIASQSAPSNVNVDVDVDVDKEK